jgi:distribution and morphology protein 10
VGKPEILLGGRRVEGRDYLFYSRLHLPTMHLSGLMATRLAPTLQAQVAFVNQPATRLAAPRQQGGAPATAPAQPPGNLLVSLQHDTGRYSGEYTYSATDGMFGLRGLYNFAWQPEPADRPQGRARGVDEEEMMDGGLRGRISAGGEIFFSVKQKSLGREYQCI